MSMLMPAQAVRAQGGGNTITHRVRNARMRGDRYHREHAIYSPYYKWRRCFWQSFSLQCPPHRHLHKINMIFRGRRRWETKLNRSRGRRPDCNPERQRAATETRSIMRPSARSWGSGRHSLSTGLHPRIPFKKHTTAGKRQNMTDNGPSSWQQVVSGYQEISSDTQRWSSAHMPLSRKMIGSYFISFDW